MPVNEQSGWMFLKRPQYVALKLGAKDFHELGIKGAALQFISYWQNNLDQVGSGKIYNVNFRTLKRGGKWSVVPVSGRPSHRASAPGGTPAIDSGQLRDSIELISFEEGLGETQMGSRAVVGTYLPYAAFLEFGVGPSYPFSSRARQGEGGQRPFVIEPRPHLRKTINEDLKRIEQDMIARMTGRLAPASIQKLDVSQIRRGLLRLSAKLGSFQLLGINSRYLFLIRRKAIKLEQALGDYQAFTNNDIAGRIRRKIVGRNIGIQLNKIAGNRPGDPRFWKAVKRTARTTMGQIAGPFIR
jgi:phage gpG-like protein